MSETIHDSLTGLTITGMPAALLISAVAVLSAAVIILIVMLIIAVRIRNRRLQSQMVDPLTGNGSDIYFRKCFQEQITETEGTHQNRYYIAYLSTDLQKIEDFYGKTTAVELQLYVSGVLSSEISESGEMGNGTVDKEPVDEFNARIADGVFTFAFHSNDDQSAVERITALINRINLFDEDGRVLYRAGVFKVVKPGTSCETAIVNARKGYVHALQYKKLCCLSDDEMLKNEAFRTRLKRTISVAVKKDEIEMHLQYIIRTDTGKVCGAETLSRWNHPELGMISPVHYVEAMKIAGIIDKLDYHVLDKACSQLEKWTQAGNGELRLSCNFTRITLSSDRFMQRFMEIIEKYSFDRSNLIIELTEDSLADNSTAAYSNIMACKELGCRIALDDLGSGFTSFVDLCDYPIDIIKVDKVVVEKCVTEQGYALLRGICMMAHYMGIEVLCEGVENEVEDRIVRDSGCDYIQGFYYSDVYTQTEAVRILEEKQYEMPG